MNIEMKTKTNKQKSILKDNMFKNFLKAIQFEKYSCTMYLLMIIWSPLEKFFSPENLQISYSEAAALELWRGLVRSN